MRTTQLLFPAVLLAISACSNGEDGGNVVGGTDTAASPDSELTLTLEAAQVVGGSVETGTGRGRLSLDRDNATIQGSMVLIDVDASEVTLNRGFAGENGPVLGRFNAIPGGTWSLPPLVLTAGDLVDLDSGGLYVSVTNDRSPAGAVRGQIVLSSTFVNVYSHTLFGSQVVPAVDSAATASSALTRVNGVDNALNGSWDLVIHVNVHGLDDVTSVDVHEARAGRNGPMTFALIQDPFDPGHWFSERSAVDELTEAELAHVHCRSGGACDIPLYLDVHTLSHPGGALRAQVASPTEVRFVSLSSDDVVPAIESDGSGMVAATITGFRDDGGDGWDWIPELLFNVNLEGFADAAGVTLNYAPVGQVGPAVVSLQRDSSVPGLWARGNIALDEEPDSASGHGWYLNVTTPAFPDGELRGQWTTQVDGYRPELGFTAWNMDPADGATLASMPGVISVAFNHDILPESATLDTVELLASGGDASFNEGNEWPVTLVDVVATDATMVVTLDPGAGHEDVYQLRVDSILAAEMERPLDSVFIGTFTVNAAVPSPTFAELQDEIFTPSCAQAGCHGGPRPAFGLDLSAGAAFASMVGVVSAEQPGLKLVEPGDQNASYVIRKLLRRDWDPHPAGQPRLSNASLQKLRRWIDEGAQNN